jgi:uncharacterized protein
VPSSKADPIKVERRDDEHRFVVTRDGLLAELTYQRSADRLVLVHDGMPEPLGGHGIGSALVEAALDWAREFSLMLVPRCPFARRWLREHAERTEGVTSDWH